MGGLELHFLMMSYDLIGITSESFGFNCQSKLINQGSDEQKKEFNMMVFLVLKDNRILKKVNINEDISHDINLGTICNQTSRLLELGR